MYIICQKSQKGKFILKARFSFSIGRLLYPFGPTWQGIATPFGAQQHHAKETNSSSYLAKRYVANNWCVMGLGVEFWPRNSIFILAHNMNSLDLQCSLFHGRNFPISPLKSSKTNRELLQPGAWPATDFFKINEVTCNDLLAHILGLWRNHYESNSIVKIFHTMCNHKDDLQTGLLCHTYKNSHKLNIKYIYIVTHADPLPDFHCHACQIVTVI